MSGEPLFLTLDEVLEIHADMIASFGGQDGVREMALLESAIAQPSSRFGGVYLYDDFTKMAAAYLFGIAKNHAFTDGNKRTPAAAAIVFLKMNERVFPAPTTSLQRSLMTWRRGVRVAKSSWNFSVVTAASPSSDATKLHVAGRLSGTVRATDATRRSVGVVPRPPAPCPEAFTSWAQVTKAMSDPRYDSDPAYRAKVENRIAASRTL